MSNPGNYVYETGSMTGILGRLKWESLKKRRKDNRLILLYKGLKGNARIPTCTDDLIPKTRRGRNQHSLAFQIPSASNDVYKYSFFPQTIRDWNDLPESLISSSELSDRVGKKLTARDFPCGKSRDFPGGEIPSKFGKIGKYWEIVYRKDLLYFLCVFFFL